MQIEQGSAPSGTYGDHRLLSLDDDLFTAYFDRHPFKLTHNLVTHPLFQLPRLAELAGVLQAPILYFRPDHAINQVDAVPTQGKSTFTMRGLARPTLPPLQT